MFITSTKHNQTDFIKLLYNFYWGKYILVKITVSCYTETHVRCTTSVTYLKCKSLNVKWVSTIPVVLTLVLNTSCSVGI